MATKVCKNGHHYDSSIYGDNCPFCPSDSGTRVNDTGETVINGGDEYTIPVDDNRTETYKPTNTGGGDDYGGGHTIIRPAGGSENTGTPGDRKIIGLLVTYSTKPSGEIFNLYEGRNIVGRDPRESSIVVRDGNMSAKHLLILYRAIEGVYWASDMDSSNGTYINGEFVSERVKLNTNDVIVIGATKFIFLAIPQ